MGLYETKREFTQYARLLPKIEVNGKITNRYEDYNITDIANGYCKATDEHDEYNRNIYMSALLLRFWYIIDKMYQRVKTCGYDHEDCFNRLYECIEVACQYRAWQNPDKHTNAQACINQVIAGRGVPAMVYEANLQKNGPNLTISLDEQVDDDSNATRSDLIADETTDGNENVICTVQELISQNKIIESIITDMIAFRDVFKHEKKIVKEIDSETGEEYKYTQTSSEFWPFKLVQELNTIDDEYIKYFMSTYKINSDILKSAVEDLSKATNQKKYKMLEKSMVAIKAAMLN